jgi:hypothetical protein
MNRTHANAEEKNRLRQFKKPNQQQAAVTRPHRVSPCFFRLHQFVTAARFVRHSQSSVDEEPMELSTPHQYHLTITASTIASSVYALITATSLQASATNYPAHRMNTSNPLPAERRSCL